MASTRSSLSRRPCGAGRIAYYRRKLEKMEEKRRLVQGLCLPMQFPVVGGECPKIAPSVRPAAVGEVLVIEDREIASDPRIVKRRLAMGDDFDRYV